MKINIITPSIRPHNLLLVFQSILGGTTPADDVTWYIVYDGKKITTEDCFDFTKLEVPSYLKIDTQIFEDLGSVGGNGQRNHALNRITEGWIYFLDDDNLLHPELFPTIRKQLETENKEGFIFSQFFNFQKKRVRHAAIGKIKEGSIDTAQYLVNSSIAKNRHWKKGLIKADGAFIREILDLHRDKIKLLHHTLAYFNGVEDKAVRDALSIK